MIKVVVPVSGGKDSQACLKWALEHYAANELLGLFCDTGWEHPTTYAHIDTMRGLYGVKIERISDGTVSGEILKSKRFPNPVVRSCTDRLKIQPSRKYYKALAEKQGSFDVWLGMRLDESRNRKNRYSGKVSTDKYAPHDVNASYPQYLHGMGVSFVFPILEWSNQQVFDFLEGRENPLYAAGFDRVGCFPCLASTRRKHSQAFDFDDFGESQKRRIIELEKEIGKKHEPANTGQMCMFCHI